MDWVWWRGGTLLSGCMGTFDWAGEVGSHMPRRGEHGCSMGDLMLDRAGVCQKWLPLPLGACSIWAASVENEGSLDWWWGPLA